MAYFQPRVICALATPVSEVGGREIYNESIFAPSLKLVAITVQKLCAIKNFFWKMHKVGPFLKSTHSMCHSTVYMYMCQCCTVNLEIFIVKIFS